MGREVFEKTYLRIKKTFLLALFFCAAAFALAPHGISANAYEKDDLDAGFVSDVSGTVIYVTDLGADGTDTEDDYKAIQAALDVAKNTAAGSSVTVMVPAGTYYISRYLGIYSHTRLILDDEATIVRMYDYRRMLRNGEDITGKKGGHDQLTDVVVSGGTWDGNITDFDEQGYGKNHANIFFFWHASDISINNTTLKKCCGTHFIELSGVSDCLIGGVTFQDFVRCSGVDYSGIDEDSAMYEEYHTVFPYPEAVQFDFTSNEKTKAVKPYDNTTSENIVVENCVFRNCVSGVGTHHSEYQSSNITIKNNKFENIEAYCVTLSNTVDVVIKDNEATSIHGFARVSKGSLARMTGNAVYYDTSRDDSNLDMIYCADSVLTMEDNKIIGGLRGLCIYDNSDVKATGNLIVKSQIEGIYAADSRIMLDKNTVRGCMGYGIYGYESSGYITGNICSSEDIYETNCEIKTCGNSARIHMPRFLTL